MAVTRGWLPDFKVATFEICDSLSVAVRARGRAVAALAVFSYVVWFRAGDTLPLIPENGTPSRASYRRLYKIVGAVMLVSPLTAFVLNSLLGTRTSYHAPIVRADQ